MAAATVLDRARHMLDAIAGIERLTGNKTVEQYAADPDLAAAVERYFERLSEASRYLPDSHKRHYPDIDWRRVADLGNILRHAYDQVIDRRLWEIVAGELPRLKSAVLAMIANAERETKD